MKGLHRIMLIDIEERWFTPLRIDTDIVSLGYQYMKKFGITNISPATWSKYKKLNKRNHFKQAISLSIFG